MQNGSGSTSMGAKALLQLWLFCAAPWASVLELSWSWKKKILDPLRPSTSQLPCRTVTTRDTFPIRLWSYGTKRLLWPKQFSCTSELFFEKNIFIHYWSRDFSRQLKTVRRGLKTDRNHIPDKQPSGTSQQERLDKNYLLKLKLICSSLPQTASYDGQRE